MAEDIENVTEEAVQPQESQASEEVKKETFDKEANFKRLRDTKEQLERENRELKNLIQSQQKKEEPDDDLSIDDDDIVEGKVVKQLHRELKNLKKSYETEKLSTVPDRLKAKFPDFDQVVTKENIELLKETEPEIYSTLVSGNDVYMKGVSAYKTLKGLGIVKDDPYKEQREQVQKNNSRPQSAQAIKGQSALSDANIFAKGLTPDLKKQLFNEMVEASKAR